MRLLIVSLYWPPAGGPGVQRPLRLAGHLAELGVDVHVVAPDDPKWLHCDESLVEPRDVTVHRVANRGPRSRRPGEELRVLAGLARLRARGSIAARALLVPDAAVIWSAAAAASSVRLARRLDADVVLTTSPPGSVHLAGLAVRARTRAAWVADLRDSVAAHVHRTRDLRGERLLAGRVARRADAIVVASNAIGEEMERLGARSRPVVVGNGCDYEDFAGLEYRPSDRFRITHAGSFFGRRDPRPFLEALARIEGPIVARFVGDFRARDLEHARALGVAERLDLIPYVPRRESLALQRDSDALLLLVPDAGGRGRGVLSGKVFEYLAAERPILAAVPPAGEAASLIERIGAGSVVAADDVDGLEAALRSLLERWRGGELAGTPLAARERHELSRRARAEELLGVLERTSRLRR